MNTIEIGPQLGQTKITGGLDYYKPTMSQLQHARHPDAQVTFTFKNRNGETQPLGQYIDPEEMTMTLGRFASGWDKDEVAQLSTHARIDGTPLFSSEYLGYLASHALPEVKVAATAANDIALQVTGDWPLVTFWETVAMSEINETYYANYIRENNLDTEILYEEGDRRLTEKINILKNRPDIKIAEFGTRRRFSYRWQRHVLSRLAQECPENLIGTSNVALAEEFGLQPIGTYAHEMPMVYAALAEKEGRPPLDGHAEMLTDWQNYYDQNLSTALTDTFTSNYFFTDFTTEQAISWCALRHDSGDPTTFGEQVIDFYKNNGIDPLEKTIVFSDGLDIDTIVELADHFSGRINLVFGWGTTLTNDLGLPKNSNVMKATEVDDIGTVKLSDNEYKYTGDDTQIEKYQAAVEEKTKTI